MSKDWGFSGWVEVAGKRIWFDIGNDADIFAANVKVRRDLTSERLIFVVLSHRHSDHMARCRSSTSRSPGGVRQAMQRVSVALAIVFS